MNEDIRWKQRFDNLIKAYGALSEAVELSKSHKLSKLENQGVIQGFEYTHELAWNVLKDYLESMGTSGLIGSKDTTREAFKRGLIENGEEWMDMIRCRNLTSHTYDEILADTTIDKIFNKFYPQFSAMVKKFNYIYEQET